MNAKNHLQIFIHTLLLFIFTCGLAVMVTELQAQDTNNGTNEIPEERSPADKARRSKVAITIGTKKITVGAIEDQIASKPAYQQKRITSSPEKMDLFIQDFIRQELFTLEAEKEGFGKKKNTQQKIKQNSVQILIQEQFDQKFTPESITDEQLKAEYEASLEQFQEPEMVRAAHILIKDEAKAKELLEKAKKLKPQEFAKLARENSEDKETKQRGGDLRYFTQDGKPPRSKDASVTKELVVAAFALKEIGDVVPSPIKVGDHFSILMKTGYRAQKIYTLEQVQNRLRSKVWRESRKKKIDDYVQSLRKKYTVEVHPERVEPIKIDDGSKLDDEQKPMPEMKEHEGH